jgi:shikimate kinase
MKIYLIGMPGSGKSTLGTAVAAELHMTFIDLDKEIEKFEESTVPEIFLQKGEDHFRQIESKLLYTWAGSRENFVMATGGGAPCMLKGIDVINKSGLSIFLDVPIKELVNRLRTKNDRPLLGNDLNEKEKILISLREARLGCYRQAKVTVTNPDLSKVLEAIHFKK